jgi:hypothetical protein
MAVITLTANTNYSALSVADGDIIELNGFQLTLDVNPTAQNIIVTAAGNAGTLVLGAPSVFDCVGWTYQAGTTSIIPSIGIDKTLGGISVTAGSVANARGISILNGVFLGDVIGGSVNNAPGCNQNFGIIKGHAIGGSVSGAHGIATNNGTTEGNAVGGSASGAYGVNINNGTILGDCVAGTGGAGRNGLQNNGGIVLGLAIGSATDNANGINANSGLVGGIIDNTGKGIETYRGSVLFVGGADVSATIPATVKTIYSLFGPLSGSAIIAPGTEVIELSTGGGGGPLGFSLSQLVN